MGEEEGTKPRKVLMSMEEFEELLEQGIKPGSWERGAGEPDRGNRNVWGNKSSGCRHGRQRPVLLNKTLADLRGRKPQSVI